MRRCDRVALRATEASPVARVMVRTACSKNKCYFLAGRGIASTDCQVANEARPSSGDESEPRGLGDGKTDGADSGDPLDPGGHFGIHHEVAAEDEPRLPVRERGAKTQLAVPAALAGDGGGESADRFLDVHLDLELEAGGVREP